MVYAHNRRGYEPTTDGYLVRAESRDGGRTWSRGVDSIFPNPNAAVDFQKLKSGNLLLIYNNSMNDRTPLSAAISTNGDKTYPHRRDLVTGKGPYAYPYALQGRDGVIHLVFTSNERTVINYACLTEKDILSH